MKTLQIFSLAVLFAGLSITASAQTKTETFKVNGNCGMCKTKIEKAAKEAGAKDASWDADKKELTVKYKSSSTNAAKIQQKVAEVGYDNAGFKATADSYNKLHGCCKYDRTASPDAAAKEGCCSGEAKCNHAHTDGHAAMADCCKDGKCTKPGHDGKDCCKNEDGKMPARTNGSDGDCCKDGKCTKEGHSGADCCKKSH